MTKPISEHRCRKVLNELLLVADHTYRSFGAENPKLEKADHALMDAIRVLRTAVEWEEAYDPQSKALTQEQIDASNNALMYEADPEYRRQAEQEEELLREHQEQFEHDKRRAALEKLLPADDEEGTK
jgi:hypothetical protein